MVAGVRLPKNSANGFSEPRLPKSMNRSNSDALPMDSGLPIAKVPAVVVEVGVPATTVEELPATVADPTTG